MDRKGVSFVIVLVMVMAGCAPVLKLKTSLSQPPNSAEVQAAQEQGCAVAISALGAEVGRLNGITPMVTWKNISGKTIKYCRMKAHLTNAVNDTVECQVKHVKEVTLEFTGPDEPGAVNYGAAENHPNAFFHRNATQIHIDGIRVEFMDGTFTECDTRGLPWATGPIAAELDPYTPPRRIFY